ncbi:hypothetical protein HNQ56_001202 [Anaerotaenia torta]
MRREICEWCPVRILIGVKPVKSGYVEYVAAPQPGVGPCA